MPQPSYLTVYNFSKFLQKTVIQRIVTKMAIRIVTKTKIQMNKKIIWFSKKFRKIVYS